MTADARDAIMRATYEALCDEGYTELTTQAIADRTDRSKAALFYHYESKADLVRAFIEYLLQGFDERIEPTRSAPPVERLAAFVEWGFASSRTDETEYHTAMLELRAQAPYDEGVRAKLRESDDRLRDALVEILADGMESGAFRDHDAESVADLLLSAVDGARTRRLTLGRDAYGESVRDAIVDHLIADVLAPRTAYPTEPAVSIPPDERLVGAVEDLDGRDDESTAQTEAE
ncbi:TetR/AcrR family transcriptional regulator [Halovivax limisalsi]|uniref:TetR/AcrR family transcriptional regulator n=1 Tax=Halovivax limisalsi TaxID=1453760 RepID=UPI001FFD348A|nr:TetR/AcrR family transcriptional regulator [Halovivax limisalsi]